LSLFFCKWKKKELFSLTSSSFITQREGGREGGREKGREERRNKATYFCRLIHKYQKKERWRREKKEEKPTCDF